MRGPGASGRVGAGQGVTAVRQGGVGQGRRKRARGGTEWERGAAAGAGGGPAAGRADRGGAGRRGRSEGRSGCRAGRQPPAGVREASGPPPGRRGSVRRLRVANEWMAAGSEPRKRNRQVPGKYVSRPRFRPAILGRGGRWKRSEGSGGFRGWSEWSGRVRYSGTSLPVFWALVEFCRLSQQPLFLTTYGRVDTAPSLRRAAKAFRDVNNCKVLEKDFKAAS